MVKTVTFDGTYDDYSLQAKKDNRHLMLFSNKDNTSKTLHQWLIKCDDVTVKGRDFVKNYSVLYKFRDKSTGKYRMEFISD